MILEESLVGNPLVQIVWQRLQIYHDVYFAAQLVGGFYPQRSPRRAVVIVITPPPWVRAFVFIVHAYGSAFPLLVGCIEFRQLALSYFRRQNTTTYQDDENRPVHADIRRDLNPSVTASNDEFTTGPKSSLICTSISISGHTI